MINILYFQEQCLLGWKNISFKLQGWIVKKAKQSIQINFVVSTAILYPLQLFLSFYLPNMTQNIWVLRSIVLSLIWYDSMHSKKLLLAIINLRSARVGCWSYNVSNLGILLGQMGSKVHFFPSKFFFALNSWKSKFRS